MSHIRSRSKDRESLLADEKIDTSVLGSNMSFTETRRQKMLQHGCAVSVPNISTSSPSSSLLTTSSTTVVAPSGSIVVKNPVCVPHTSQQKVADTDTAESRKNQRLLIMMAVCVGSFAVAEFVFGLVTGSCYFLRFSLTNIL